jgi:hypothetical protein
MPVCKLYLLFISANAAQEKEKKRKSAPAHWCFKVVHSKVTVFPQLKQFSCKKYIKMKYLYIPFVVLLYRFNIKLFDIKSNIPPLNCPSDETNHIQITFIAPPLI